MQVDFVSAFMAVCYISTFNFVLYIMIIIFQAHLCCCCQLLICTIKVDFLQGLIYTITDVKDLHDWMVEHIIAHPLFERVPDKETVSEITNTCNCSYNTFLVIRFYYANNCK